MFHPRNGFPIRVLALLALATLACGALAAAERVRVYDPGDLWAHSRAPLLEEGFENATFPPGGWLQYDLDGGGGTGVWARATNYVHSGSGSAFHNDTSGAQNGWLVTPFMVLPAAGATLTFWEYVYFPTYYQKDSLWVCTGSYTAPTNVATPPGWTQVAEFGAPPNPAVWRQQTVSLAAYAGQTIWLAFRYEGNFSHEWYIDDVLVTPVAPELTYDSHALLTDVCGSGGAGDGNGVLDPGESGTFSVTLQNTGTMASTGVSAVLGTATAGVTITQNTSTFPDIPAGGTGTSQAAYAVSIDPAFTCGEAIDFTLTITDASRRATYATTFSQHVGTGAPIVQIENFDLVTPPALPLEMAQADVSGTALNAATTSASVHPAGVTPHSGTNMLSWNCWTASSGNSNRVYYVAAEDLSTLHSLSLSFWMYHDTGFSSNPDRIQTQYSLDAGTTWTNIGPEFLRYAAAAGWSEHTVDLSSLAGLPSVMIGALCISGYGNDIHLDDATMTATPIDCTTCIPAACTIESCDFTAEPGFGVAPLDVALDATVVAPGCAGAPVFDWDYGDSQTGSGQNVTHTYAAEGLYTVTLTVTVDGETCVTTHDVQVYECQLDCEALADPQVGLVPLEVTFATWTEAISCPGNTLYHWDFGDGEATDEQAPTHLYTAPGMYTATLTVTVEGTTIECVSTVQIVVNPYDLHFLDDQGWSRLCVNSQTGAFEWQVLAGPNAGLYPGVCQISALDGLIDYTTEPGLPYDLRLRYQPETGQANGVFKMFAPEFWAGLYDRNVADNPPGCDLSEPAK